MTADRNTRIQERAYHLWLEAGRPHDTDQEHWYRAECELAEHELIERERELQQNSPATAGPPERAADGSSGKSQAAGPNEGQAAHRAFPPSGASGLVSGSGSRGGRRPVAAKPAE